MGTKKAAAERIAALEQAVKAQEERMNAPQVATAGIALEANCAKEAMPHRPSRLERRNKLIAAYVAFQEVRFEVDEGWIVEKALAQAIGRLELRD